MELLLTYIGIYGLVVLMAASVVFLVAQARHDNSVMDIAYGPLFAIAAWATIVLTETYEPLPVLIAVAITLWALRLGIRIGRKNWNAPEDARYARWREEWMQRGQLYFMLRSFLQVNVLQGIIITLVAMPFHIAITFGGGLEHWLIGVGLGLFLLGLSIETRADIELDRFIARKKAGTISAPILRTGLFAYSRHPNYFGEMTLWWGLALAVSFLPLGILAFIGPVVITYTIARITGPILEAHMLEQYPEAFATYKADVPYIVPRPTGR